LKTNTATRPVLGLIRLTAALWVTTVGMSSARADDLLLQAGAVLTIPGLPPQGPSTILIRDGRIMARQDGFVDAAAFALDGNAVRLLDLRDSFLLPGLMDTHVHLTSLAEPDEGGEVILTSADLALRALNHAQTTLAAGFTTVMDMGTGRRTHELAIYALRDAIQNGQIEGPTILAAGSLLAARTAPQSLTDAELTAIVATAHSLGRKVIADGAGAQDSAAGLNAALRAGVDALDTAMFPDAETWLLLEQTQAFYVPHLYALQAAVGDTPETLEQGSMGWLPRPLLEQLFILKGQRPAVADAIGKRVRLVVASDPGVFPHGQNARELLEYVRAGITPMAAIVAATRHPAELFGLADRGTLEPGMVADVIAVQGNPLQDISALTRVVFVMHQGRVARQR